MDLIIVEHKGMDRKRARRCIGIVRVSARSLILCGLRAAVFWPFINCESTKVCWGVLCTYQCYAPPPPLYEDRWGIGGDLTHRMCQIPHPSITIQCQIPILYIHTRICAVTRANACAGQKPHPWGVISW